MKPKSKKPITKLIVPKGKCNSDTFLCDTCGTRMILKIYGNSTPCKASGGCSGTMYRQ